MTPKLLALAKVCSVLGNIHDVSWHLSKRGNELEKRWTISILDKNGALKNKACLTELKPSKAVDLVMTGHWIFFFNDSTYFPGLCFQLRFFSIFEDVSQTSPQSNLIVFIDLFRSAKAASDLWLQVLVLLAGQDSRSNFLGVPDVVEKIAT